ncbi:hypothetical protein [Fluviicola taffensis]|uniref:Uncharacterized protein n=1 Tax=Fluviicola taffensis (strain DSM 16823 / NCIMB 13979 / RW262) TaxID=755732 RepID=F2IB73_FLUTR|nr:hypothetical protein [Fluviicola taffensis]AEA42156.1 hypothetical protein Fluta_0146 [Fluviicola taffensis DSM 16823]
MQTHLKEMPQLVVISIAIIILILSKLEGSVLFRAFNFILLMIFTYCFVFQSIYLLWNWINPNRGLTELDGKMVHVGMDLSGIPIGLVSLIIAVIVSIINLKNNKGNSIKIERYLAIATIISSSLIFIYFELI